MRETCDKALPRISLRSRSAHPGYTPGRIYDAETQVTNIELGGA